VVADFPVKQVELLFDTVKWWILMLAVVVRRLGLYLHDQGSIEEVLKLKGTRDLTAYFTEDEIDRMYIERDHPRLVQLRIQADSFFVAYALYQIDALLKKLSSQSAWKGELASTGNAFRKLYKEKELGDLRDFIAHVDEHIALGKLDIVKDFEQGVGMKVLSGTKRFPGAVDTIYVFGAEFEVKETVWAAYEVLRHLPNITEEDLWTASD
jgi:hypothetical protein